MPGDDALRERLGEVLDRIALVQRAEGRRDRERAVAEAADRVALPAIRTQENLPALGAAGLGRGGIDTYSPSTKA
jgi:hypothetical protein